MKRLIVWIFSFVFVSSAVAKSFAEEKMTVVLGIGNRSCGSWTQARHSVGMLADVYEGWVAGFLSGSNSILANSDAHIDVLEQAKAETDAQGLWAWIDNYCQTHPLDAVAQAADALGGELIRRVGKTNHR
jgi:hypothetical protein